MSGAPGGKPHGGWGEIYFSNVYERGESLKAVAERAEHQARRGAFDQVFVVPTEPLEKLATTDAGADLISVETVAAANHGLWRVHVFNQLVMQQTIFNAVTHSELRDADTTDARKEAIAQSARHISVTLHHYGVDGAGAPDGWYERLKTGIASDLSRLETMSRKDFRRWLRGWIFAAIDVAVVAGFIALTVVAICAL